MAPELVRKKDGEKMKTKIIAACIVPGILIVCIITAVLTSGCSSASTKSPPPLVTPATPVTTLRATVPALTPGGTCREGLIWCNDHCSDLSVAIGDCGACGNACPSGQSCLSGQCCTKGQSLCNGSCSDLTADVENCGSCDNVCATGSVCHNSKCLNMSIVCPSGQTECYDEKCYDLTSDNMNCGMCGNVCPAYSGCTNSVCVDMEDVNYVNPPDIVINMPV
jgi:hypothetical protein